MSDANQAPQHVATPRIELRGVGKQWGDVVALQPSNVCIEAGSFAVLLGPSGCGKTTTLRLMAGLDVASRGQILIDGRDVTAAPPAARDVAMVFQNYALFPHLSVADNIVFGLQVRRAPRAEREERLARVLSLLGLEALRERKPAQLSGGQQQRVALARALVAGRNICLMDEPLSNLDAQLRQEMRQELRALQQRLGLTVVYVTHDQTEAMSMADQVVLLNHGRIEQTGTPRDIYAHPASVFAARFIGTPPMSIIALDGSRIRGSTHCVAVPDGTTQIGLRPEEIAIDGDLAAKVIECEYLGADSLLRCEVGSETATVRTPRQRRVQVGDTVRLGWTAGAAHPFDAAGRRLN